MTRKRYISLTVFVSLLFMALYFYSKMGGFSETNISIVSSKPYLVVGKPFKGRVKQRELGQLFQEADTLLVRSHLQNRAWVCGVFLNNPEKEKDTIQAFIGLVLSDTLKVLPEGYTYKRIPARKVLRASIKAYYLFVPSIYPEMEDYAEKNKIQLSVPSIEIYPKQDEVVIEVPVK
jgi:effector-binding domain-containing protein